MRPMSRLARRARAAMRRPPRSPAAAVLRAGGILVGTCALAGWLMTALWHSTMVWNGVHRAEAGLLAMTGKQGLVVSHVLVEGENRTGRGELIHILEDYQGQIILGVDIGVVRSRLERLPWVKEASITRQLPATLRVRLEEQVPVARWFDGARQVLVSEGGDVLRVPDAARYKDLPLLLGAAAPAGVVGLRQLLAQAPGLARRVTGATLVAGHRWNVQLGRTEVRLPADDPDRAWQRLAAEQRATGLLERLVEVVDLRNPAWLTLRLSGVTAAAQTPAPGA